MTNEGPLADMRILLGVTGGIAAYKVPNLVRALRKLGADVRAVLTRHATRFVAPLTIEALSGSPVLTEMFGSEACSTMAHIAWPRDADLVAITPATANFIGKMANGIADDLLSTMVLASEAPLLIVPSMNTRMFNHPAVVKNLEVLSSRGAHIVDPGTGELACGESGEGRMAEVDEILEAVARLLASPGGALKGKKVIVTAGPTVEPIDPFRVITNRSSGKMGYALAAEALKMGGTVTLISGPTALVPPKPASFIQVETAMEMGEAVNRFFPDSDLLIMAAAVSDFRTASAKSEKLKKNSGVRAIEVIENPDILKGLRARDLDQIVVGFAAEVDNLLEEARRKLEEKGVDLIVANNVGIAESRFGSDHNRVFILDREGGIEETGLLPKKEIARRILERVCQDFF
jgi:phosphopantothenoylcysteine decarboxylase/phosphopantothenate--cysteine ligase